MAKIPFDEKELELAGRNRSWNPNIPGTPIFSFPMDLRENYIKTMNHEGEWMPYGVETGFFCPSVIPDNIARAFVFEAKPWGKPYTKAPDMFGINWVFVPTAGGSMEDPDEPHPLEDANDWKDIIKFPDIYSWDWDASAKLNHDYLNNGKVNIMWMLNGAGFERLISFFGFENAALALVDEDQEDALKELLQALTDLHLKLIDVACEVYGDGVGGFCFHDDWGSQKSPFFSVQVGREFFVPQWQQITSHIKSKGRVADLHSCGHIEAQIENIVAGGWQSWTPMGMNDTKKLHREYGDKIVLGVCADKPAPDATPEEIKAAAMKFIEENYSSKAPCTFSNYSGFAITDPYAEGLYEASRKSK